ncbi:MAG: Rrf2 family transcriptional regulator, partial [Chloroflexi bacterium]|nr:Rrf2 family transcriptional regulator [Chloroflexota bacterium]
MKLNTRMRYGTRAMLELALRENETPVSAKEIAEHQEVSAKYLESVLASLRAANLVTSIRGAGGGYVLARPAAEITLRDLFEALEGTEGLVECTTNAELCHRHDACVTREVWAEMY